MQKGYSLTSRLFRVLHVIPLLLLVLLCGLFRGRAQREEEKREGIKETESLGREKSTSTATRATCTATGTNNST